MRYRPYKLDESIEDNIERHLGASFLSHDSIQRLKGVSFLGVYQFAKDFQQEFFYSRYDHIIGVAHLTLLFCQNLRLNPSLTSVALLAALVHDISHYPFSHSLDPYFRNLSGWFTVHESISGSSGSKIRNLLRENYEQFGNSVKDSFADPASLIQCILQTIAGNSPYPEIRRLFNSPFCPDTLDGTYRSFLGLKTLVDIELENPESLVNELRSDECALVFSQKQISGIAKRIQSQITATNSLYNQIFQDRKHMAGEAMLTRAIELLPSKLTFPTKRSDDYLIRKMVQSQNHLGNYFWLRLREGLLHVPLSLSDPPTYNKSLNVFYTTLNATKGNLPKARNRARKTTEDYLGNLLSIDSKFVIMHTFKRQVWDENSYYFRNLPNTTKFEILWKTTQGKYDSRDFQIEVYIPPESLAS